MKLPIEISQLLTRFESNGFEAFVVGGCVRDTLLGKEPADWDICTSAYPEEVQKLFADHFVIPTGLKHGTVTVVSGSMNVEITTYRQDGPYLDNRHPESVTYTKNLLEDLKRRDFTINAMAYSPRTGLVDYFDGQKHLEQRLLCCVGTPASRFSEDALRILRGLRFAATYHLTIETETAKAIHTCKDGLAFISAERIYVELKKILESSGFATILSKHPDILAVIFPDVSDQFLLSDKWEEFIHNLSNLPASFPLRFASILFWFHKNEDYPTICKSILQKLKPEKNTIQHIMTLVACQVLPLPESMAETRRFVGKYGSKILTEVLAWNSVQLGKDTAKAQDFLVKIQEKNLCCTTKDLAISGKHLQEKGLSGTEIGAYLQRGLDAVIDEIIPNTEESLIKFLFS